MTPGKPYRIIFELTFDFVGGGSVMLPLRDKQSRGATIRGSYAELATGRDCGASIGAPQLETV